MKAHSNDIERLRSIKTLPQLVAYLRDDLDWPIEGNDVEEVTFDYDPKELGFEASSAVEIKEIKQIRPLETRQPWGIFWINFEKKRLPIVILRRILANLAVKKRSSARRGDKPSWRENDLLLISAYGEDQERAITFAHFSQDPESPGDLPILKVLGWDDADAVLHLADAHHTLTDKLRWPHDPSDVEKWRNQWSSAFTLRHREVITTTKELVGELAKLAVAIRKRANTILARESERGPMRRLYSAFQTALIHDLTEDDFADVIAQTISYGLLVARFSRPAGISVSNLVEMIPPTNPFLRELLEMFLAAAGRKSNFDFDELGIQDVVELLNRANPDAVKSDFGNRTRDEDPVIHFYEHFLTAYDKKKKVKRGVFFTPQPVVSFIVRSVHELLQTEFGLEDGFASIVSWGEMVKKHSDLKIPDGVQSDDFFVMILDPAVGTATFLVEVIEVIFQHLKSKWEKQGPAGMPRIPKWHMRESELEFSEYWNAYVTHALFPRLYGYELMMAPYTIAHMKLGLKLSEISARLGQPQYEFKYEGRAHIYLTNSLEPPSDIQSRLVGIFPALAHEATAVNEVKHKKRFTVVIGNPPYAYESVNKGVWITSLIRDYYKVDGCALDERNPKGLLDDYVKFLRFAHWAIETIGIGIVGMITNHAFLDNPTFRGMRQQMMMFFCEMHLLDLHGNAKKKEVCPDGSRDENVFDIQQGVGVGLLLRKEGGKTQKISYSEFWGLRQNKYEKLASSVVGKINELAICPCKPFYLLIPQDAKLQEEYYNSWKITDIFPVNSAGLFTSRDGLTIHHKPEEVWHVVNDFVALPENEARRKYMLPPDVRDWKVSLAQQDIRKSGPEKNYVMPILYRPFDIRFTYYSGRSRGFLCMPRSEVMSHMIGRKNLGLITVRQVAEGTFNHVFASREIVECRITLSNKGYGYLFPIYLYPNTRRDLLEEKISCHKPNLCEAFVKDLTQKIELCFVQEGEGDLKNTFGPKDILYYLYAVLHSPTYRIRYAEFLRMDFPRLPLTSTLDLFRTFTHLGGELFALHLMESPNLNEFITKWHGVTPSGEIEKVSYADETVWIDKGKTEGFNGVPEEVWNFHIGGYQICEKWLKDRKGRRLSAEDIQHYQKIVVALNETIRIMDEIDRVIEEHGGWPGAFTTK
jgi:hypothetical protein